MRMTRLSGNKPDSAEATPPELSDPKEVSSYKSEVKKQESLKKSPTKKKRE